MSISKTVSANLDKYNKASNPDLKDKSRRAPIRSRSKLIKGFNRIER